MKVTVSDTEQTFQRTHKEEVREQVRNDFLSDDETIRSFQKSETIFYLYRVEVASKENKHTMDLLYHSLSLSIVSKSEIKLI